MMPTVYVSRSSLMPIIDTNRALTFPQIRMKRLAKLQASSASTSNAPSISSSPPPSPAPPPKPKSPAPAPAQKHAAAPAPPTHVPPRKKAHISPPPFYYETWENETLSQVFQVTLDVRLTFHSLGRSFCGVDWLSVDSLQKQWKPNLNTYG